MTNAIAFIVAGVVVLWPTVVGILILVHLFN